MKTKSFNKRLLLKKTTVANLEERMMGNVRGGTIISCNEPCHNTSLAEPCDCHTRLSACCNTSVDEPCDCHTRLSACCDTSVDEPCCA